jgi:hypothetical protein
MSAINERWSDDEREAMGRARVVERLKAREVQELARAGRLELDGRRLAAFDPPLSTIRDQGARYRRRQAGEERSALATAPPRDAIEALRQRLINLADAELTALEKQKRGERDPERMRQLVRVVREAAAIPARDEPRPVAPGQRDESGTHNGGKTRGGLAAQILASHNRTIEDPEPSIEPLLPPEPESEPEPEPPSDPAQEIAENVRRRLEPVMEQERPAPRPAEYRTMPTAMSGASQLKEAREKFGWDPLAQREAPPRRSRRASLEDTSSMEQ